MQTFDQTRRQILFAAFILAVPLGLCMGHYPIQTLIAISSIFVFWIIFKYPEIWLIIVFLAICDFFSMVNEDLFRIAGVFRLHDLFFLSAFLPVLFGIIEKVKRLKYVFRNRIAKAIYLLIALCIVQTIVTMVRHGEPLSYIIRINRIYFYYLLFFPYLYVLLNPKRRKRFVKLFITCCIILCTLFITQFIVGADYVIFHSAKVVWQNLQGFRIPRLYIKSGMISTLTFHISLAIFLIVKRYKHKKLNMGILLLTGAHSVLSFSRAHIFGIFIGSLLGIITLNGLLKRKMILKIGAISMIAVFIFCLASLFNSDIPDAVMARVISTYDAVIHQTDTFGYRLIDNQERIETIKDNWVFGIGFVHDESGSFISKLRNLFLNKDIRTGDSGLISLMLDFGIIGVLYFCFLTFLVFRISKDIYRHHPDRLHQAIALGIWCFFLGRVLSSITLCPFSVYYHNVIGIVISLVFLAILNYVPNLSPSTRNPIRSHSDHSQYLP